MSVIQPANNSHKVYVAGEGPPLLLVHGFPLDHRMWDAQLASLAKHYQVIAPDLRGFGGTPHVDKSCHTMADFADDLAVLLEALNVTQPAIFCGLSMGGYIGWQFWRHHRERLAGLIICDSKAVADTPEAAANRLDLAKRVLAEGTGSLAESMPEKLLAPQTLVDQPAIVTAVQQQILHASPQGVAAALTGMSQRPDVTDWLSEIDVPTLLVVGEHDGISPPAEMQEIATAIPGAGCAVIAGAGHMSPLEQPADFLSAALPFLQSLRQ